MVGALASPLLVAAGAGLLALLFVSFESLGSTQRYETDFAGLFLLAALAAWFALSSGAPSRRRKAVRVLGAGFVLWGCFTGVAISFIGEESLLRTGHPGTWSTFENLTSPISTAMATAAGHPVLAAVQTSSERIPGERERTSSVGLTSLGAGAAPLQLPVGSAAQLTIVCAPPA